MQYACSTQILIVQLNGFFFQWNPYHYHQITMYKKFSHSSPINSTHKDNYSISIDLFWLFWTLHEQTLIELFFRVRLFHSTLWGLFILLFVIIVLIFLFYNLEFHRMNIPWFICSFFCRWKQTIYSFCPLKI